jgi:pimeloyl-ACP methyl ester carboxylesterase
MTDVTLNNGSLKLAASVYGSANAPPLLFLHGLSLSRDTWEEGARRLMDRFQVWALDFRGHGHSDHAEGYALADFVSDAQTALMAIGRPAIIVGHSLGGVVAGTIAQSADPKVRAVILVDPPWYLGERREWERSGFQRFFELIRARHAAWRREGAPLAAYLEFVSNAPSPSGGAAKDHVSPRHLLSQASALQRQDTRCWDGFVHANDGAAMAAVKTEQPFVRPALVIQADPACGAALLDGHEERLKGSNPTAKIVRYAGSGHAPHRLRAFEERFYGDVEAFTTKHFAA